jgi:hypothetical protein
MNMTSLAPGTYRFRVGMRVLWNIAEDVASTTSAAVTKAADGTIVALDGIAQVPPFHEFDLLNVQYGDLCHDC